MDLWRSVGGMLEVELTSAEPEQGLAAINHACVEAFSVEYQDDLSRRFQIRQRDYKTVASLAEQRGDRLRIIKRFGIYWELRQLLFRPILMVGTLGMVALTLFLPTRILFVHVAGNQRVPDRQILAAAEECGLHFGASRVKLRSEKVKNALLSAVPQLQWAGVNTTGCVAIISVRERSSEEQTPKSREVTSIVADRDGYILEATTTRGNPLVHPGQAVKEGQVLISAYTDCGIRIQATRAEGEILALTNREFTSVTPAQSLRKEKTVKTKRCYSLLFQKKRINLWKDSGIWDSTCGRIVTNYFVTLPGGFRLPIALQVETYQQYELFPCTLPEPEARTILSKFARDYLTRQMVAGRIHSGKEELTLDDGCFRMDGSYVCAEMIGRERREQIGDKYGETN